LSHPAPRRCLVVNVSLCAHVVDEEKHRIALLDHCCLLCLLMHVCVRMLSLNSPVVISNGAIDGMPSSLGLDKPTGLDLPRSSSNSSMDNVISNESVCAIQFSESFTYKNGGLSQGLLDRRTRLLVYLIQKTISCQASGSVQVRVASLS
jgi:hypothetical protein